MTHLAPLAENTLVVVAGDQRILGQPEPLELIEESPEQAIESSDLCAVQGEHAFEIPRPKPPGTGVVQDLPIDREHSVVAR